MWKRGSTENQRVSQKDKGETDVSCEKERQQTSWVKERRKETLSEVEAECISRLELRKKKMSLVSFFGKSMILAIHGFAFRKGLLWIKHLQA